jgi:hypothetical protein
MGPEIQPGVMTAQKREIQVSGLFRRGSFRRAHFVVSHFVVDHFVAGLFLRVENYFLSIEGSQHSHKIDLDSKLGYQIK